MSFGSTSLGSRSARTFDFGRTHVVRPKGKHQATIVWLHGLGDNGLSWSQLLETLPLPNIKWICPTAPTRPVAIFGGFPCTAWFDVGDLSEEGPADVEGLDSSAAHVANLLSTEPADIKLGVGGFSMGAATALYSASCCAYGKYGNGNPYTVNISAAVGLSGWLPCAKSIISVSSFCIPYFVLFSTFRSYCLKNVNQAVYLCLQLSFICSMLYCRSLKDKIGESEEAARRAASLPLLLLHGKGDDVVRYKFGEKSAEVLSSSGFRNMTFKSYNGLGHYTVPEEMDDFCKWIVTSLGLETSR